MSGDMSNADLGVAKVDAVASRERLSGNQLTDQHSWSLNLMNERSLGYLLCLFTVVLGGVWMADVSPLIRYSVTGLIALMAGYWILRMRRSKSRLQALRAAQVQNLNSGR
ncbi:MAG: hypothetical protein KTR18_12310 [Acidiferrobacterales bacterium]|nr:hypothetical protein [Acidiferrobacterales bacterium]